MVVSNLEIAKEQKTFIMDAFCFHFITYLENVCLLCGINYLPKLMNYGNNKKDKQTSNSLTI
jgi:hypothetical protein